MKLCRIFILWISLSSPAWTQITFSEVMYDPDTDENHDEYVEVYNLSERDSVDLSGWLFSDGEGTDMILPYSVHKGVPPKGFGLILDGSYPGSSATYDSILAQGITAYIISDRALGSNGLSNTRSECLSLTDTTGDTVAIYCYSADNLPGYPDEKILPDGPDTYDNWKNGLSRGGTPGRHNSVSPYDRDIGFREPGILLPPVITAGGSVKTTVLIENTGLEPVTGWITLTVSIEIPSLMLLDSVFRLSEDRMDVDLRLDLGDLPAGEYHLMAKVEYEGDQNQENNTLVRVITLRQVVNDLVINEIKFLTDEGEPEWIELYNFGQDRIYLKGWMIADSRDTLEIDSAVYFEPGSFLVIAGAGLDNKYAIRQEQVLICSGMPNLNNDNDEVVLIRPDGAWHERVAYSDSWLQDEIMMKPSLERINPYLYAGNSRNWGPCVAKEGATPGNANSILSRPAVSVAAMEVTPDPFSPDGDGRDDYAVISGSIPDPSARLKIIVFDIRGRVIRTLLENRYSGNRFDVVWDGADDAGRKARIGIYIIYAQAIDDLAGVLREMMTTVVLANSL
jgi:hypothetical protein